MATRRGANFLFKWVQHCGVCILKKESALCSALRALLHTVKTAYPRTWRLPTQNAIKMVPKRFINGAGGTLKFLLWFLLPLKAFPSPAAQTRASTVGSAATPRPPGPGFRGVAEDTQGCGGSSTNPSHAPRGRRTRNHRKRAAAAEPVPGVTPPVRNTLKPWRPRCRPGGFMDPFGGSATAPRRGERRGDAPPRAVPRPPPAADGVQAPPGARGGERGSPPNPRGGPSAPTGGDGEIPHRERPPPFGAPPPEGERAARGRPPGLSTPGFPLPPQGPPNPAAFRHRALAPRSTNRTLPSETRPSRGEQQGCLCRKPERSRIW